MNGCSPNQNGFLTSCASYLSNNLFGSVTVLQTWTFQVTPGYNQLYLPQTISVNKGNLILLSQINTSIAIDVSGTALYSDLAWQNNVSWTPLNTFNSSNWRFYINTMVSFNSYAFNINALHTYSSTGLYNFSIQFLSSSVLFQQIINVTDCT